MQTNIVEQARIFKAFCDENRMEILIRLRGGELCACKLLEMLSISQPTLSHHMRILCQAGVVIGRKEGKWTHYSLCEQGIRQASSLLEQLIPAAE